VRKPLRAGEPSRRTLDQRLALRFPSLTAAGARLTKPTYRVRFAHPTRTPTAAGPPTLALSATTTRPLPLLELPLPVTFPP
jgi:hypothetical protein